ncbi:GNAT family N-acetyltransferase [Aggregatilinea lenta]|uniref:GNAT family N-acetyltransferase n=1 Tax=Aggregatilinea lenta TaxID=913108 RepID=UPI000E5B2112|nr:GNAT family N-acetyltransferase [Aggregatilinea lenta]
MPLRAFKLPDDVSLLVDLIPQAFHYPDNEAWSIQPDELEGMTDALRGVRRVWPLLRVAGWFSPALRDVLRGFVWEEDGQVVGLSNVMRQGTTDHWYIANVAVLPAYRRRGIARGLVEACMDYARDRGAAVITLDVVAGNTPAYALYERLGFSHFATKAELVHEGDRVPEPVGLPDGYTLEPSSTFEWEPRFDLMQRITPPDVAVYQPVEQGRFRQPGPARLLMPVMRAATGTQSQEVILRGPDGGVVASAGFGARTRSGGRHNLRIALDPAHPALAPYLVRHTLGELLGLGPGHRVELSVPHWQPALVIAAEDAGFARPADHQTMGLRILTHS